MARGILTRAGLVHLDTTPRFWPSTTRERFLFCFIPVPVTRLVCFLFSFFAISAFFFSPLIRPGFPAPQMIRLFLVVHELFSLR